MKIIVVFFFIICGVSISSFSQDRPIYFVQFKISSINSVEQAQTIDKKIKNKKGILSTHSDYITSTFFCTLEADADYVFEDFQSWFSKIGFNISCFNKGQQGVAEIISPHQLKNCEEFND